jgi:hypothetical protein
VPLSLQTSAPYVLQQTISLRQSVQRIVALAHCSYEAAESINLGLACESSTLINLSDGDLNRCVVLGLDDAVGCAALAGDVAEEIQEKSASTFLTKVISAVALGRWEYIQVNEFSLVVLHVCGVLTVDLR